MFCNNLKNRMTELNITLSELSRRADVPKSSISAYLSGSALPREKALNAIAEALRTTPENLTAGEKKITIKAAAEAMGVSQQFLRICLQQQILKFGEAVKLSGNNYTYHINPEKFQKYLRGES